MPPRRLQIAETLGRFGINPSCKHILAARFDATPEQMQQLGVAVRGQPAALSGRRSDGECVQPLLPCLSAHRLLQQPSLTVTDRLAPSSSSHFFVPFTTWS